MEFARLRGLHTNFVLIYGQAVMDHIELVEPGPEFRTDDTDDDKYTAATSGAHADYLVSSDKALLDLGSVLEARVVTPEAFLEVVSP